jgi:hypothetical protein
MSQDAYALFQTIKTIKGHTMIRTSTYATQKYALSDTYLLAQTTNITSASASNALEAHSISTTIPTTTGHTVIPLNGSPNIKFSFWIDVLTASIPTGLLVRISGWNKTRDKKYVPSLLYYGTITGSGTHSSTINGVALYPATTLVPRITVGASFTPAIVATSTVTTIPYMYIPGGGTTGASLILNTFGFTHLEVEFAADAALAGKNYNAYVTEY